MEACIRRVWLEHLSLSNEAEEKLRRSLARWGAWKQARAEQVTLVQLFIRTDMG